jgi:kynurenine 3-monooxygenase
MIASPGAAAVSIVGAGPTGALLALLLRRRGFAVTAFDGRPDPRGLPAMSGRSINLALADRGIHALKSAGVYDRIAGAMVPMRGRLLHQTGAEPAFQPYGGREGEAIYSISRHRLNQALLEAAAAAGVELKFEHRLEDLDVDAAAAHIHDARGARRLTVPMNPLLAADGAGSTSRRRLAALELVKADEVDLEHGYKELTIPAGPAGRFAMRSDALHIWPRGNFMLIALPNADGSFTATLFLPKRGAVSFESLDSAAAIREFLLGNFPDACELVPDCVAQFRENPTGFLGTVYADRWSVRGAIGLIGDAAHAIVPFHGQGMNCCFEDCVEFDACLERETSWEGVFERFFSARKPNTDAIAAMALENYLEMREHVADPNFRLRQSLSLELERRHPRRFIPRYSMVMFHHEIPYRVAQDRGSIQARLLQRIAAGAATLDDVDFDRAAREIKRELPPVAPDRDPA